MTKSTRLWLLVAPAALVVGSAAAAFMAASDHLNAPALQAALLALTGGSFIVAGLVARTRRPENRTGMLLIWVGFTWFLGGLIGSNNSLLWTIGVAVTAVPAAFLVHLLIAYPGGRLQSSWERILVVSGYVLVSVGHFAHLPVDPDPMSCRDDGCPSNAFLVSDNESLRTLLVSGIQLIAVVYLLAVVVTLVRRWKRSSAAARRALAPVLLAGGTTLLLFAISVGAYPFSSTVSEAMGWTAMVAIIGVPFLFLTGLLKSRLARADISRVLAEEPVGGVQERIRELLRDPTAELLYTCAEPLKGYVDVEGRPREAVAEPGRAVTLVEREDRRLGAILHDEALLDEPELLGQVAAAVALEVERDRNLFALQASERRSRALLEAVPDRIFRITEGGLVLDVQENVPPSPSSTGLVGKSVYESPAPRELIDRVMAAGREAIRTGELQTVEWELGSEGDVEYGESRIIPSGEGEFFIVVRDISDRKRRELEQASLHRVALAVASEAPTEQIFNLVAEEIARVLGAHGTNLIRYEADAAMGVIVGSWRRPGSGAIPVGQRRSLKGGASEAVARTGRPFRRDATDPDVTPELREIMREFDIHSLVAAPIELASRPWGAVVVTLMPPHSFPPGAEERLGAFTRLVSLALANEEARGQLAASRARLVTASDEERRRLERNLHDGAQQRLVSVSVSLRLAQAWLDKSDDSREITELLTDANEELGLALEELRELARGIHPAVLTERGLGPALASLADRAPVPVEVQGLPSERLPTRVEAAAYYVVSEALANIAKYADASSVIVRVGRENGSAVVEVADDGVGGADPALGSGLHGLADRIEALDGYFCIDSPLGKGTTIRAEIPCP